MPRAGWRFKVEVDKLAGPAERREESVIRSPWRRVLDEWSFWLATLSPRFRALPETDVDCAIRERGERLRKAFPETGFDHPGARQARPPDGPT